MAGPEVVIVDVDKYKFYNKSTNKLKLEVSACWFEQTIIESKNATIYLNWKGYLYVIPVSELLYSSGCCNNAIFIIEIDLEKNILTVDKFIYIPVLTTFNQPNKPDFSLSFGYIKVIQSEYNEIIGAYSDNFIINIPQEYKNKLLQYYLFNSLIDTNQNETIIMLYDDLNEMKENFENNFIIPFNINENETNYYRDLSLITEQLDYNWTDTIILNNKTYTLYNYKQCFVNTEFFKQIRRK